MDITDEVEWTVETGKVFLEKYLKNNWSGKTLQELMMDAEIRNEIVAHMREETGLSIRKIADLLGIKRGSVQNVKPK